MMSAANTLNHYPQPGSPCFTANGANAASNSNLAIGNAGADAITAYIWDFGANNNIVGHRRWLLYPQTQVMATGDVPDQGSFSAANATWVFDANTVRVLSRTNPRRLARRDTCRIKWCIRSGHLAFQMSI
jgi:hypothetical protein